MKHHFADLLDREGNYWSIVPNRDRYAYSIDHLLELDDPSRNESMKVVTLNKEDKHWKAISRFTFLEELTLHEPSKEQLTFISRLVQVKRLRITHLRTKDLNFISELTNVEELVLEYVSGFSDLSPLRNLRKLKSLHLENLRKVVDFSGLSGISSLRLLAIDGTFDWKQPIQDFEFLAGLPGLEVLDFGNVINKLDFPAFLPILHLKNLKKLIVANNVFDAKEYAFLSVGLPEVDGADWQAYHKVAYSTIPLPREEFQYLMEQDTERENKPEVKELYSGEKVISNPDDEWYEFTGKKAGKVKTNSPKCGAKCSQYAALFESMKEEARSIIAKFSVND